jgi:hypothetical protein
MAFVPEPGDIVFGIAVLVGFAALHGRRGCIRA